MPPYLPSVRSPVDCHVTSRVSAAAGCLSTQVLGPTQWPNRNSLSARVLRPGCDRFLCGRHDSAYETVRFHTEHTTNMNLLKPSWVKLPLLMDFSEISVLPISFWRFVVVNVVTTVRRVLRSLRMEPVTVSKRQH